MCLPLPTGDPIVGTAGGHRGPVCTQRTALVDRVAVRPSTRQAIPHRTRHRPSLFFYVVAVPFSLLGVGLMVMCVVSGSCGYDDWMAAVALTGVGAFLLSRWEMITVDIEGVRIRRPFLREFISWEEIGGVRGREVEGDNERGSMYQTVFLDPDRRQLYVVSPWVADQRNLTRIALRLMWAARRMRT